MRLGKNMKHALAFARKYKGWHTFSKDQATVGAVTRLQRLGLVKINEYHQFSIKD